MNQRVQKQPSAARQAAANIRKRRWKSTDDDGSSGNSGINSNSGTDSETASDSTLVLRPPMPTDWEQAALPCFFENFVIAPNSPLSCAGYYHFLEDMCAEQQARRNGDAYLLAAARAAACAAFANRHSGSATELTRQARGHFGAALASLHAVLSDPVEAVRDEALTAVTLLSIYEVCAFIPSSKLCIDSPQLTPTSSR